jgi:glycogen debranching enzyme
VDDWGDLDGDGFVEYAHKSQNGLTNQGWKDSHDSVTYANGELCKSPIALCEVQGYVYAAKKHTALLADARGEKSFSEQLKKSAADLKERLNTRFWDKTNGTYFLALDGDKNPCKVMASNMGHCLFTGIADKTYARSIAEHLMGEDMFSGWGVRTLRNSEVRYNPMSYHNGSVWPHDNALIAAGLARYGCMKEALVIMKGLFDASLFMELQRMPELFCGFNRRHNEGPTAYPVACSPQAWSVGVVFMLLQSCLRLEINGLKKKMVFTRPRLPQFIQHLVVSDLALGGGDHCDFEMHRHKSDVSFHVVYKPADWELVIKK